MKLGREYLKLPEVYVSLAVLALDRIPEVAALLEVGVLRNWMKTSPALPYSRDAMVRGFLARQRVHFQTMQ